MENQTKSNTEQREQICNALIYNTENTLLNVSQLLIHRTNIAAELLKPCDIDRYNNLLAYFEYMNNQIKKVLAL